MPPKVYHGGAKRSQSKKNIPRSKYAGVHWHSRAGKWVAQISIKCVRTHLGYFKSDEDAAKKYDAMARMLNDGRILNFPEEEGVDDLHDDEVSEELEEVLERSKKRQKPSGARTLETLSNMAMLQPKPADTVDTAAAPDPPTGEEEEEEVLQHLMRRLPRKMCWGRYH